MDIRDVIRARRMVRRFSSAAVDADLVHRLLSEALTAPSAGSSRGVDVVLLDAPDARHSFYSLTTTGDWFKTRYEHERDGIVAAPVLVVPVADPSRYVERYSRPDKTGSSLAGLLATSWPTPYWLVDAAFVTMQLLLLAEDAGLGALFHRLHRDPSEWLAAIGAPPGVIPIGAVALGWPAPDARARSRPSTKFTRPSEERIHSSTW